MYSKINSLKRQGPAIRLEDGPPSRYEKILEEVKNRDDINPTRNEIVEEFFSDSDEELYEPIFDQKQDHGIPLTYQEENFLGVLQY